MKKKIFIAITLILAIWGIYFYNNHIIKNYQDDMISYDYGIKNDDYFAFVNLKIDVLEWIKKHPSDFFKELALINNEKYFTGSGWISYNKGKISGIYIKNKTFGTLYIKSEKPFTKIIFKDVSLLNKSIEFFNKNEGILPDDINFSKISYDDFITLSATYYSALIELNIKQSIKITTPLSIEEIFNSKNLQSLIESDWWISENYINMPL